MLFFQLEKVIMLRNANVGRLFVCLCLLSLFVDNCMAREERVVLPRYEIAYATYLGGTGNEQLREVIPYEDGSVLVGGQTNSADLPVTDGVVQPKYGGEPPGKGHPGIYGGDCFLTRISADGSRIIFATYLGGSRQERNVYGMALDRKGNILITSMSRSADLPTTKGVFQDKYGGGPSDWMVAKLSPGFRRLMWCTYIGGSGDDSPRGGLAIDGQDNVYIVGGTASPDFPTTSGVFQRERKGKRDAAIVKLRPDGSGIVFSTLLGGNDWDGIMGVSVDALGGIHVAGHTQSADFPLTPVAPQAEYGGKSDCFLAGFSPDAKRLLYSTYLGGRENEFAEHKLSLSPTGKLLLTGVTASDYFPTTQGAFQRSLKGQTDGFLTKLSADRQKFEFSTFLGGSGGEFYLMPTLDKKGNIFVVGHTDSRDFPATENALQKEYRGGRGDGVLSVFSTEGSKLLYATYLGGQGADLIRSLALGPRGEVYLVGSTTSKDFPVTANAVQPELRGKSDAFVVKLVSKSTEALSGSPH